jgi:hypothetical protein
MALALLKEINKVIKKVYVVAQSDGLYMKSSEFIITDFLLNQYK